MTTLTRPIFCILLLHEEIFAKATLRTPQPTVCVVAVPVNVKTLGWFQAKEKAQNDTWQRL
jgi:hypothetical protein